MSKVQMLILSNIKLTLHSSYLVMVMMMLVVVVVMVVMVVDRDCDVATLTLSYYFFSSPFILSLLKKYYMLNKC